MKKIDKILLVISIAIVAVLFALATKNIPFSGIDNFNAKNAEGDITISYLFSRSIDHAFTWNGRIGEMISYIVCPLPNIVYKTLNLFFYVIFILLIIKYALDYNDTEKNKIFLYPLIITAFIFYLDPLLWNAYFWMAGSCNHLWGICILLIAFLPVRKFFFKSYDMNLFKLIPYLILMLISGTVSESYVPVILGLTLLIFIYKTIKEKKVHPWILFSFTSMLLGYIWLVFLCPSTKKRYLFYENMHEGIDIKSTIFENFFLGFKPYLILIFVLIIIYLIILLIKKFIFKQNIKLKKSFIYTMLLYISSYSSIFVMFFSSTYNNRAVFIICFTTLVLAIYLINEILCECNSMIIYILSLLYIAVIAIYSVHLNDIYTDYVRFDKARDKYIEEQIINQNEIIVVPLYSNIINNRIYDIAYESQLCSHDIIKRKYNIEEGKKNSLCR